MEEKLWEELVINFRPNESVLPDNKISGIVSIRPSGARKLIQTFVVSNNKLFI